MWMNIWNVHIKSNNITARCLHLNNIISIIKIALESLFLISKFYMLSGKRGRGISCIIGLKGCWIRLMIVLIVIVLRSRLEGSLICCMKWSSIIHFPKSIILGFKPKSKNNKKWRKGRPTCKPKIKYHLWNMI